MLRNTIFYFKKLWQFDYPRSFKILVLATFIDRLGSFLLFPFFALYITQRFSVGMTEVGFLFTMFSAGSIIGSTIGGALADKYGRRSMLLFGLIASGTGSIILGFIDNLFLFYVIAAFLGILGDFGGPARQAMVTDLLGKEKQAEGFGILRVAVNLSATIGPIIGGIIITQSYLFLFFSDAISSIITAIIVILVIPETKPQLEEGKTHDSFIKTIKGYGEVLKDWQYILFLTISALTVLVYMQMNSTLSVFLFNSYGFSELSFGALLSMNALIVVIFQFWITRKMSKFAPMKVIAVGTMLYMIGFGMYGFVSDVYLFFIAMIIITIGEMIAMPLSQSIAGIFAPEDKRGRYMAVFGFHWAIPNLFGILLAGIIGDILGGEWIWYFAGMLSFIAAVGFWLLHRITRDRFEDIYTSSE
ncbi:MAG: MFS transporter [Promethearchaeota archaeon]|nr:MAG: MFS transporter [Candidatus Lokiarchaeota archaeon]